jgi:RNA polymerase sigma-70 factor, ECF subfamily
MTMKDPALAAGGGEEEGLLDRARAGDGDALDAIVGRHYRAVYAVTYRVLGDPELASDATQDAFIKAISALSSFRGEASFQTWLLRIAANTARSAGRKKTSRREVTLEPETPRSGGGPDPAEQAVTRAEAERAARALEQLPEKQRLAVTLRINQDLSHREIAEVLGSSEGAARVNYHLGIKRLRELLA